jgi:transposase
MNKFSKKKRFVGVDISEATLDLAIIREETYGKVDYLKVPNSFKGFEKIIQWLEQNAKTTKECLFCMEHTGTFGLLFYAWLTQLNIDFCVVPGLQIKRSLGMTRGKNDQIDAKRIADYAFTHKAKLEPFEMPSAILLQIKQLLSYREQMVRIRTSLMNSKKEHERYQKVSGLKKITNNINEQIQYQDELISSIEIDIIETIKSNSQMKKNFELMTSIKGIGLIIASFMLVTTNNFMSFENGRKFACYGGMAPFAYSSGTSVKSKSKVSQLGNKTIKSLFSNGANSAATWDPQLREYYKRKKAEGKDHKLIINSISCKLINRIFAVVKRQTPFVELYEHKFA